VAVMTLHTRAQRPFALLFILIGFLISAPQLADAQSPFLAAATPRHRSTLTHPVRGIRAANSPSGPDDPTDPFIVAQATALHNDPNQIFAFVRDQIALEIYGGSVRGARGVLWSKAGNTLDKASLLVALLGASGFSATYEHTILVDPSALIRRMFAPPTQLVGCPPPTAIIVDPGFDGNLYFDARDYYWIQYGPGNIALDPNVPGAQPGQTIQAPDSSFTTVPQNLRQQVTVKVNAEIYNQASSLFGGGPNTVTVLTQTFDTSALVGNPISVGNFVKGSSGGNIFSATTFTYTPYILIGSGGPDISQDNVIVGTNYQEVLTSFPLSSQILTGIFLEIDALSANSSFPATAYTRTIVDRIGPAARQGLATVNLNLPSPPAPAVTDFDVATVNILTGRQLLSSIQAGSTRLTNAYNNYLAIKPQLANVPTTGALTSAQQAIVNQAVTLAKYLVLAENELITMSYNNIADKLDAQLAQIYYVRSYPNTPRLTIAQSSFSNGNASYKLDVLKNDLRVVNGHYQNLKAAYYEEVARGQMEALMEGKVLAQATGQPATSIGDVLAAVGDPNLLTVIAPAPNNQGAADPTLLDRTTLTPDAKALILAALANNLTVITPTQMVTVNGLNTVGWWEIDQYGHMVSHFVDGGHQAIVEFAGVEITADKYNEEMAKYIGKVEGGALTEIAFAGGVLNGVAAGNIAKGVKMAVAGVKTDAADSVAQFFKDFQDFLKKIDVKLPGPVNDGITLIQAYAEGLSEGIQEAQKAVLANLPSDPPVFKFLSTPLAAPPPNVTPGSTPAVQLGVVTDPYFTQTINSITVPLIYQATITNKGPAADTFRIQSSSTQLFYINPNVPNITLQPGQVGTIDVCIVPADPLGINLPPPGTPQPFTVTVTSNTDPNVTTTATTSFNMPTLPTLQLSTDPQALTVAPGGSTPATLTLNGLGNVAPGSVTLSVAPPAGITVTGLTSPVNIGLNSVVAQNVSFNAAANAAITTYNVPFTASYSAAGSTQSVGFTVPLTVMSVGTCAVSAAAVANSVLKQSLGATLAMLSTDMNASAATPTDPGLINRVVGDVNLLITSLDAPFLVPLTPGFTSAKNGVASATVGTLINALNTLNTNLCTLRDTLNQASDNGASIYLSPNVQVAIPQTAATYTITMQNTSSSLRIYDLSVTGVPAGITAQFSQPSITLGPASSTFSFSNAVTLSLTPGASFVAPFTFNVVATPRGTPLFAKSVSGSLQVRAESVIIDNVIATPAFANPGAIIKVSARVFAVVNQDHQSYVQLNILDSAGHPINFGYQTDFFNITTTTTLQTINLNFNTPIDTTNFKPGAYTLSLQVIDSGNRPIPGATATGTLLIGSPLSATLTATPPTIPPGPGPTTVQATLTIGRDTTQNPVSTLIGSTLVQGAPKNMVLYQNGSQQLAYVCTDAFVNIVDVTNPASLSVISTFAHPLLTANNATGFAGVTCAIYNTDLIIAYSRENGNTTTGAIQTHFAVFSLANPLSPVQVGGVFDVQRPDSGGLYVAGNSAIMIQNDVFYNPFSFFIFQQNGDVWSLDLTNAPTGTFAFQSDLYPCGTFNTQTNQCSNQTAGIPNDQFRGGPYAVHLGTAVNSTTSYFASSNSTGGNILNPGNPPISGELLVVNTSNPAALSIGTMVAVPQTAYLTAVAFQGNTAVAVGDSTGVYDINSGYVGTLVLASFDISNPSSPVLLNQVTTALTDKVGANIVPLGNNTYAVGGTLNNGKSVLLLVDASNPNALRYIPYDAPFVANPQIAKNGYFYTLSAPGQTSNQLSVFQLQTVTGPQLSVSLQIAKTNGVALAPNSFNQTPSSVTTGTTFDSYVWNQPSLSTITFNMNVSNVNPGDAKQLVTGGELDFTVPSLGSGKLVLGPLSVLSQQIMSISPETQAVANAGNTANYTITISNPTNASQTFNLSLLGVPSAWGSMPASLTVGAGGSGQVTLALTPGLNTTPQNYLFTVAANTASGISANVTANIGIGSPVNTGGNPFVRFLNFLASLSPAQITVGLGDQGITTITLINTGNFQDAIFFPPPPNLPLGWGDAFTPNQVTVAPGLSNPGNSVFSVFASRNTTPGTYPITIPVQYGQQVANLTLTVVVPNIGVQEFLNLNTGDTHTSFKVTVFNSGQVQEKFNLSVIGAFAQSATLASPSVTLAPLAQQDVAINLSNLNYLPSGNAVLQVRAVSNSIPAVQTVVSATVNVLGAKSVAAAITPSPASANPSAPATLLFQASNTGNVNDTYTAAITGVTGPVTASLVNTNGQAVQTTSPFYVPALADSRFQLNAQVTGAGAGSVTVKVTSTTDATVNATATVAISQLPGLIPTPTSLQFSGPAGSAIATSKTIAITSSLAALDFTVATDQPWLHATPAAGNTSGTNIVTVTVDTTGLASSVNGYTGNVRITSAGAGNSPLLIPVSLVLSPTLNLSRHFLNYGYSGSLITSPQPILVQFTGGGVGVNWTVTSNQSNITASPSSGTGNGQFQIVVTPGPGGTVTVTSAGSIGSPQQVQVNVKSVTPGLPFGSFDTPLDKTTGVVGAIPVTGWALDNIEVTKVDIWREPINGEPPQSNGLVFIGDAVFVIGARPDVENLYSTMPWHFRGGWGYQMLTNFLPNSAGGGIGNGTYKIHAIAHNMSGTTTDLGTRTITVDNAHANKPFGTIDTPGQGGTASGNAFVNFGWALTPNPSFIPQDGSTLSVQLDGVVIGQPTYNNLRSDIASLFPGYANSNGAVGFLHIDTTRVANGVHTIAWVAYDNAGHGEGLGSRYFNVLNTGTGGTAAPENEAIETVAGVKLRKGHDQNREPDSLTPDENGTYIIEAEELDRIELHAGVNGTQQALPPGSTLKGGVFYWQLAPGLLGEYDLLLTRPSGEKVHVLVRVSPKKF
jgi:uncharacterized membrane protein